MSQTKIVNLKWKYLDECKSKISGPVIPITSEYAGTCNYEIRLIMYYEMTSNTLKMIVMHNLSFLFIIQFRIYVIFESIIRWLIS